MVHLFVIDRLDLPRIVNLSSSSSSKLENHHRHHDHRHDHQSEVLSASLQAFRSHVSDCLNQLSPSNSKPGSKLTLSLSWIKRCLEALSEVNRAFAKLIVDIDHPVTKWEAPSMEEYLSYSLKLLNLLNSITRSLSHLGQSRLSISYALTLIQTSPASAMELLRENQFKNLNKNLKIKEEEEEEEEEEEKEKEESDERIWSGKELIVHQALTILKSVGFWVCGIVLSGLSGDFKPYSEMKKPAIDGLLGSSSVLMDLDSAFVEAVMEREDDQVLLEDVREVSEDAACLVAAGEILGGSLENLSGKLEGMESLVDGIGKEVDGLFKEILGWRNELLDCLRQRIQ